MSDLLFYGFMSFFGLIWLYIAARMVARGILRSIEEWKEKRNNDY